MTRLRFPLAQLMAIVLYSASASQPAKRGCLLGQYDLQPHHYFGFGGLGRCLRCKTKLGMTWAGFADAGGVSLVIWLATSQTVGYLNGRHPRYTTTISTVHQSDGFRRGIVYRIYSNLNSLNVIFVGLVVAVLSRLVAVKNDQPNP